MWTEDQKARAVERMAQLLHDNFLAALKQREASLSVAYHDGTRVRMFSMSVHSVLQEAMMDHKAFSAEVDRLIPVCEPAYAAYELAGANWYANRYAEEMALIEWKEAEQADADARGEYYGMWNAL